MVEATAVPGTTVKQDGEAERAKSGCITWTLILAEWVNDPSELFPVTMTLY
jgi:hypothetical protein